MSTSTSRIFINGRFLTKKITGTERFAIEITRALDVLLKEQADAPNVTILAPQGTPALSGLSYIRFMTCGKRQGHLWEQWDLPRAAHGGLLLNFTNSGPVLHSRQIVVIHDALVYRWPQNYSFAYGTFHRALGRILARRSRIMTVSSFSQHEIAEVLGLPTASIPIIPNGHEHILARKEDEGVLNRLGLRDRPYFLFVGSPSPTKNLERAIKGFALLNRSDVVFVIVGAARADIFQSNMDAGQTNVMMPGRLTDEEIVGLYHHATALVFPSLYEGFGIPPLEAMALGCPVIASQILPVKEVCGNAALYFDPMQPQEIAARMKEVLDSPELRCSLIEKGQARHPAFSWNESARIIIDFLRRTFNVV